MDEFYEGVYAACEKYDVDLIGGDTTSSQKGFVISITAIGEVAPDKFVKRSTAEKGDLLCVSGFVGAAFLGLTILEREKRIFAETGSQPDLEDQAYIVGKLLKPEARKDIIEFFAANEITPSSMIDVSDGLSSEALHICKLELDPTACALSGGEDYELLFTLSQKDYDKIVLNEQISVIGYMTEPEEGHHIITRGGNKHALVAQGWNHLNG
jgi:thiamine-monophosphate kinase